MKKTYISPNTLVVELRCKSCILTGSLQMLDTPVSGDNGGWVKEENSPISDVNVWDDEW